MTASRSSLDENGLQNWYGNLGQPINATAVLRKSRHCAERVAAEPKNRSTREQQTQAENSLNLCRSDVVNELKATFNSFCWTCSSNSRLRFDSLTRHKFQCTNPHPRDTGCIRQPRGQLPTEAVARICPPLLVRSVRRTPESDRPATHAGGALVQNNDVVSRREENRAARY
jgi:hypothetical protein